MKRRSEMKAPLSRKLTTDLLAAMRRRLGDEGVRTLLEELSRVPGSRTFKQMLRQLTEAHERRTRAARQGGRSRLTCEDEGG